MREYRYRVDAEGRVFHDGSEVLDPLTLRLFVRAMSRTEDGRWLVICQGERNWFEAADTPLVVQRMRMPVPGGGGAAAPEVVLAGDHREPLDPATLESERGRLYCRVRRGALPARFGRLALQQLAPHLVDEGGRPVLVLDGARHAIPERRTAAGSPDAIPAEARTVSPSPGRHGPVSRERPVGTTGARIGPAGGAGGGALPLPPGVDR